MHVARHDVLLVGGGAAGLWGATAVAPAQRYHPDSRDAGGDELRPGARPVPCASRLPTLHLQYGAS
jgi:hypothetical protein